MDIFSVMPGNARMLTLTELKLMAKEDGFLVESTSEHFSDDFDYIIVPFGRYFNFLDCIYGKKFGMMSNGSVLYYVYRIEND